MNSNCFIFVVKASERLLVYEKCQKILKFEGDWCELQRSVSAGNIVQQNILGEMKKSSKVGHEQETLKSAFT